MTAESTEVKTAAPISLKHLAEEFIVALQWELSTGSHFTGQPIEAGKMRMFSLDMPHGASFLPIARQMSDEIKAETCGREKCVVLPVLRQGMDMEVGADHYALTVLGSYSVIDTQTMRAARLIAFDGFIRFEVCLEYREVITL